MTTTMGRVRVSLRIAFCALPLAALTYGCGGSDASTEPAPGTPGITIVAGAGQTDTVNTTLLQALVVEVRDAKGRVATGRTVRFTPVPSPNQGYVLVGPLAAPGFYPFTTDVVDALGRAKALVQFQSSAGTARLEVAAPELGLVDTVAYTIKPGVLARLNVAPRDTSVPPGASYTLRVTPTDQYGNPIAGVVPSFSATGATVTSAGVVTAPSTLSRSRISVSSPGPSDSASVNVVTRFPMIVNRAGAVVRMNSDGTGATTLATSTNYSLSPSSVAATPTVVFYEGDPTVNGRIWVAPASGSPHELLPVPPVRRPDAWPRLSPDGVWVYFERDYKSLWRARLDGSGQDSLASFTMARTYAAPTISPDGGSVAIEDGSGIQIVDVATKTSRRLPVTCGFPHYSPDGAFFSCLTASSVWIVRTDGTNPRLVANFTSAPDNVSSADWTPDGKWLFVTMQAGGAVLVEVSSGAVVSLAPFAGTGFFQASLVK